jgi:hypothetical protein
MTESRVVQRLVNDKWPPYQENSVQTSQICTENTLIFNLKRELGQKTSDARTKIQSKIHEDKTSNFHLLSDIEVLTAVLVNIQVFWGRKPCRLPNSFRRSFHVHLQGLCSS